MTTLEQENEALRKELLQLDLDEKREAAATRRSQRDARANARQSTEDALADARAQQEAFQDICSHRKGGKDAEQILLGNSSNYSVIKHTYPLGNMEVLCQRCGKEWKKPTAAEYPVKADYRAALKEYQEAINFPTDNVPSGSQMFALRGQAAA